MFRSKFSSKYWLSSRHWAQRQPAGAARLPEDDVRIVPENVDAGVVPERLHIKPAAEPGFPRLLRQRSGDPHEDGIVGPQDVTQLNLFDMTIIGFRSYMRHRLGRQIEMRHLDVLSPSASAIPPRG